jgi:hypothetical protein
MGFFSHLKSIIGKVPVVGKPLASVYGVAVAPAALAEDLAHGARIDHALVHSFKDQVADIKTLAPYAQTVISFVPGVGPGVSGALAASLAIANGHPLSEALVMGIKGAIPGGQLAQSAFGAASSLAQGKGLDQAALDALPMSDDQREALHTALSVAGKVAKGQKVQDIVLTEALGKLPPEVAKAVHVGLAVGHAANIQVHADAAMSKVQHVLSGVNSADPATRKAALAAVAKTQKAAEKGDPHAAAMLTLLGRHAAAQRVTRRFRVHAKTGMVLRVGAKPKGKAA